MTPNNYNSPSPQELALQGYYLFPCNGKEPRVRWRDVSSIDPDKIRHWEESFPGCSWGLDCGKSGIVVLDDDKGKNPEAISSMEALELEYGELPNTFTVKTISGGFHYYFYGEGRNSASSKLGKGLDSRGAGGYVIAPCSPGYSVVNNTDPIDAPDWFIELIGKPTECKELAQIPLIELDKESAINLARQYLLTAEPAIEGSGGDAHTYTVACRVKDYGVSREQCSTLLLENWNERCLPPWSMEDIETKVANAYSYGANPPGIANPETVFSAVYDDTPKSSIFIEGNAFLRLKFNDEYLIQDLIATPSTGLIFGDPSAGKSFLALDMALAIACGTSWMGKIAAQGVSVYFVGEGRKGIWMRMEAWKRHHEILMPDNRIWLTERRTEFSKKSLEDVAKELKSIQDKTGMPISACFVDTLARHMPSASDENSARDMGGFINGVDWLRDQFNCVVAVVHHSGKMNKDTSRGSSAIRGAMDWEFKVENKKGVRAAIFTKMKDDELPPPMGFDLKQVNIGLKRPSAILIHCQYDLLNKKTANLGSDAKLMLDLLQSEISLSPNLFILKKGWRKSLYDALGDDIDKDQKGKKFRRGEEQLLKYRTVKYVGDKVFDLSLDVGSIDD